jgi:hypothetical protein
VIAAVHGFTEVLPTEFIQPAMMQINILISCQSPM